MKNYSLLLLGILLFGCTYDLSTEKKPILDKRSEKSDLKEKGFIARNNEAHNKLAFQKKDVLSVDIELFFGGKLRMEANLLYHTRTGETKIVYNDSSELTFNGKNVYLSPASIKKPSARFDIFTWSYFLALPYKIDDKGTQLSDFQNKDLNGKTFNVEKLAFGENIGDSPDDWYVLYQNKETNLLHAASYIVTLNKTVEEGEKDPHAIVYSKYQKLDNISIAHRWDFYGWTEKEGLTDTLGYANLTNLHFITNDEVSFEPKADSKVID
ncbi:MAG: hypothetical protein ACPGU5_08130 [Lishizhenia sp.]